MPCPAQMLGVVAAHRRSAVECGALPSCLLSRMPGLQFRHLAMRPEPFLPRRRSVRLPTLDYSESHSYFNNHHLQQRANGPYSAGSWRTRWCLSGRSAKSSEACWMDIPFHFPNVELATHVVMPEHLHGILRLRERAVDDESIAKVSRRGTACRGPYGRQQREFAVPTVASIPTIVGAFKSAVTKRLKQAIWQRGYYERVIRDENEFRKTCEYIRSNPARRALKEGSS